MDLKTRSKTTDLDLAVRTWQIACEHRDLAQLGQTRSAEARIEYRRKARELFQRANTEAGGSAALMRELTRLGLITWAF